LLAHKAFCYQIRKNIGAYVAAMGGVSVLAFTGDIGETSPAVRSLACQGLAYMGIKLDEEKNRNLGTVRDCAVISTDDSPVIIMVVANNDERLLAWETLRAIERKQITLAIRDQAASPIPIEVSAHHVHLSQADVDELFGPGHQLTSEHELSQPGQFACAEKVDLVGPKGRIANVRVLGPTRKETQVEIAMTEQFKLGVQPPIRQSGDLANTPGITLEGPAGSAVLQRGVICAQRHIHMSPEDAMRLRLRDRYVVRVRIEGEREVTYGDVVVRVNPAYTAWPCTSIPTKATPATSRPACRVSSRTSRAAAEAPGQAPPGCRRCCASFVFRRCAGRRPACRRTRPVWRAGRCLRYSGSRRCSDGP
jgi:acetate kinase